MKCSVVILNWNGEQMLRQFLPSVVEFSASPETEVVVADNGSTDGSLEVLKQFPTV
ncbi:MAG: glycosyltransferase, partial [Paludibacteraceae bacterium]|nr:glycosyltransferase [Paludibacteraceae bacterium]